MNRPNNVDKSQKDYEFARNWDMRLSPEEITEMERLSAASNALRLSSTWYKNPINMSLRDLFKEWATKNLDTINDIIKFMTNLGEYSGYFEEVDETKQWFSGIGRIIRDFIKIFKKEDRVIYVGFTIFMISMLVWYLDIIDIKDTK